MKTFDATWEDIHKQESWGKYPSIEVVKFVARNYYKSNRKTIKLLDLGCGGGANTWFLAKEGFDAYAIDGSETAVKKTTEYLDSLNLSANVFASDMALLPFEDNFFDAIIDSAAICSNSFSAINNILRGCYRITKPGGKIFSTALFTTETTGSGTGLQIEEGSYKDLEIGSLRGRGTISFFTEEKVRNIYTDAGYKNLLIDKCTYTEHGGESCISYFSVIGEK